MQCAFSQQDVKNIDLRLRNMDNRIVDINRDVNSLQSKAGESAKVEYLEFLQRRQAELANSVDRLQSELLQVKGRIEETTYHAKNVQDENSQVKSSVINQLSETNIRITILEKQLVDSFKQIDELKKARLEDTNRIAEMQAKDEAARLAESARTAAEKAALEARVAAEKTARLEAEKKIKQPDEKESGKKGKHPAPQKDSAEESAKSKNIELPEESSVSLLDTFTTSAGPAKDHYDKTMGLFKEKNYKQAYKGFAEYLTLFPNGELAANARYWMGDCLYNQNDFELAILEYQKVIAEFSGSSKAPAAMLKQGLAFRKLQDLETAKIIFQKLLNDYPKSEQVDMARKQLEILNK